VIIDAVQKLPGLLDEVYLLIERSKDLRFILTGGSACKLRKLVSLSSLQEPVQQIARLPRGKVRS